MTAQKVAVLAVLDAEILRQHIAIANGYMPQEALDEFQEARAAVSELIEAVEEFRAASTDAAWPGDGDDARAMVRYGIADDSLKTALARCKGGAA